MNRTEQIQIRICKNNDLTFHFFKLNSIVIVMYWNKQWNCLIFLHFQDYLSRHLGSGRNIVTSLQITSVVEPEPAGAGIFSWSRSR